MLKLRVVKKLKRPLETCFIFIPFVPLYNKEMEGRIILKKENGVHKQSEKKEIHSIQRYMQ